MQKTGRKLEVDPAAGTNQILTRLYEELDQFPPALGRVAKYILENPEKAVQIPIGELGAISESGEASVVRLCRSLGFDGFRKFKVALAGELGRRAGSDPQGNHELASGPEIIRRSLTTMLDTTLRDLDDATVAKIAAHLSDAKRIDIYGAGVSGIVGELFAYRLLRLRLNAQAFRDANMAHEVAHGLNEGDVAIAVSESGLTADTVRFLQTAKRASATTIAIVTRSNGPVGELADIALRVSPALHRPTIDAIASVPAKVLILEIIAAALAVRIDARTVGRHSGNRKRSSTP